jgi:hypothetical protein
VWNTMFIPLHTSSFMMTCKAPQWLAVAMLLAIATAALAAPDEEVHTQDSRPHRDNYESYDPSTHYKSAYDDNWPSEHPSHCGCRGMYVCSA